jgi:hypothetical protein
LWWKRRNCWLLLELAGCWPSPSLFRATSLLQGRQAKPKMFGAFLFSFSFFFFFLFFVFLLIMFILPFIFFFSKGERERNIL